MEPLAGRDALEKETLTMAPTSPDRLMLDRLATPIGEALLVSDDHGHLRALDWQDGEPRMCRVVGASGALTGYGGGLERKRWLLAHEGALLGGQARLPTPAT